MRYAHPTGNFIYALIFCVVLSGFFGCTSSEDTPKKPVVPSATENIKVPVFNADSAYSFTRHIVSFGPRIPGTSAQKKNFDWIKQKLESYGAMVYTQVDKVTLYNGQQVPVMNIIASFNPSKTKRILLMAHDDTRPWSDRDSAKPKDKFDGADDAAGGVAQLIEIARHLKTDTTQAGVDLFFTDVEDYGPPEFDKRSNVLEESYCLGTQYWTKHPHVKNYHAYYGILLDMTAAQNATFYIEGKTHETAPDVADKIWTEAINAGFGKWFIKQPVAGIVDDHVFVNKGLGIPCVDIIYMTPNTFTNFAPHWHTQKDNMKIISKETLMAVGQTVMNVIYKEPGKEGSF